MKCADTGFMQSFLDGECGLQESERFIAHLETCTECSEQLEALSVLDSWTQRTLKQQLFRPTEQVKVDTEAAWQTFSQRIGQPTSVVQQNRTANQEHVAKRSWKNMNQKNKKMGDRIIGSSGSGCIAIVSTSAGGCE